MADIVTCEIESARLHSRGRWLDGIEVRCTKCGQTAQSIGDGEASIKKCLARLRDKCLLSEKNEYIVRSTE